MSAKLVALAGPLAGQSFSLPPLLITIGADPFSDITWVDPKLAYQHARITWQDGDHVLVDLSANHGISLNRRRVRAPRVLQSGDVIRIGASCFRYVGRDEMSAATEGDVSRRAKRSVPRRELHAPRLPPLSLVMPLVAVALVSLILLARWAMQGAASTGAPPGGPTPTINTAPTGTATPEMISPPTPPATSSPAPQAREYPAPDLVSPADGDSGSRMGLRWAWPGALREDEWFSVWIWREDESPHSLVWIKEPEYEVGESIGAGHFSWQVIVVQGAIQGSWQRDLSMPSEARRFTLLALTPTPTPSSTPTHTPTVTPSLTATVTPTPEPLARIMITGRVYDGRGGPSAALANATLRIYLGEHRTTVNSNALGQFVAEFGLSGRGGQQQIELLASLPGFEPGIVRATLDGYAPGVTAQVNLDVALYPQATPTSTWLPPTATPPLEKTATPTRTVAP